MGTLIEADVKSAINHARNVAGNSVFPRIIRSGRANRPVRIRLAFEEPPRSTGAIRTPQAIGLSGFTAAPPVPHCGKILHATSAGHV